MKKIYTLMFALTVLLLLSVGANAIATKTYENANLGQAIWITTNPDGTTLTTYISVISNSNNKELYASVSGYDSNGVYHFFYVISDDPAINFDVKNQNFATLSPILAYGVDMVTHQQIFATVSANWYGVGQTTKVRYPLTKNSKLGSITFIGNERKAVATATIIDAYGNQFNEKTTDSQYLPPSETLFDFDSTITLTKS